MNVKYNDGGRAAAGFKGRVGDCVVRAIAIAAGMPYKEVYDYLHDQMKKRGDPGSPAKGVSKKIYEPYILSLGFKWVPTMKIGTGCRVHMRDVELPDGIIICRLSRHLATVIDGILHDTHDCSREGTRCVYGYWIINE